MISRDRATTATRHWSRGLVGAAALTAGAVSVACGTAGTTSAAGDSASRPAHHGRSRSDHGTVAPGTGPSTPHRGSGRPTHPSSQGSGAGLGSGSGASHASSSGS